MFLVLAVIGFFLYYVHLRYSRRHLEALAAKIPGPPAWPIVGNALEFLGSTSDVLLTISRLLHEYTTPVSFWLGSRLYVAVARPEDVQAVLMSPNALEKDPVYSFMEPWLGFGLFTAPVSKWRSNRKMILPSFNPRILERFLDVFNSQAEQLVEMLQTRVSPGETVDIFQYINTCSLDTICETALGQDDHKKDTLTLDYIKSATRLSQIVAQRIFKVWLHPDWLFSLTDLGREHKEHLRLAQCMAEQLLYQRKQHQDYAAAQGRKIFIDVLLENDLSKQEMKDEITTMLVAGNDTTATVASFVLLVLAIQQEEQARVRQELKTVLGSDAYQVTTDDLRKMHYLEMCIKETLRLFPVAPLVGRRLTGDVKLNSGLVLPESCSVVICIHHLHSNPELFPEPQQFRPERFSGDSKLHPFSFIPFSGGPRNCIGPRYAMSLVKVMTSAILHHFHLSSPLKSLQEIPLKLDILLKSVHGFPVCLQPLQSQKG